MKTNYWTTLLLNSMPSMLRTHLAILALTCLLFSPLIAQAAVSPNTTDPGLQVVTQEQIQTRLEALANRNLPEAENTTLKAQLEAALQFIHVEQEAQKKIEALNERMKQAPGQITQSREQLESLTAANANETLKNISSIPDAELQQTFSQQESQLFTWKTELAEINKFILQGQTRPEQIQTKLGDLQQRSQSLKTLSENSAPTPEEQLKNQAEQQAIQAQTALLRLELNTSTLLELANLRKAILEQQIEHGTQKNDMLQKAINDRKISTTQAAIENATQTSVSTPYSELLEAEKTKNRQLAEYLLKSTARINELTQQNTYINSQLDIVTNINSTLAQQVKALKGSPSLFELLNRQKKLLPAIPKNTNTLATELGDLKLNQFYLNQLRSEFSDPNTYTETRLANTQVDESVRQGLLELAKKRDSLYGSLQTDLTQLTNLIVNLQVSQAQLDSKTRETLHMIEEQMFWTPSNAPISGEWFKQKTSQFKGALQEAVASHSLMDMISALITRPWIFTPFLLVIGALVFYRKKINQAIAYINNQIGLVQKDRPINTPLVLLLDILLALPVAMALALAGLALELDGQGLNPAYGQALFEISLGWLIFQTIYQTLSANNVAINHFGWNAQKSHTLRRQILQIGILVLLMVAIITVSNNQSDTIAHNGIAIMGMILCYLILSFFLARMLVNKESRKHFSWITWLIVIALILTPLALMVATMVGYYYTAIKITQRLINTFYILLFWALLEGIAMRWLSVEARRLAYQRAIEKRQMQIQLREQETKDNTEPPQVIEEPVLDVTTINQQSLKIIRMFLFSALFVALYAIWADVLVVFNHFNDIVLYSYTGLAGQLVPLTLMNFIIAIVILVMMIFLVRNLPGTLEMLVLSKLHLSKGVSYAITTILSYIIIALGISISLGILGVSWEKLQWLVAALSVGLGFGLQEIFANFVSGIILLFERPVRIGDRITIGGVTGTVNRIQIRATQIIDPDSKEVIIPNKTFVTGQLINWTLTNTITRIAVKIGVAYNADINKTKQILMRIANNNPRVIRDPGPSVSFVNFGADTLDLELSMLVGEIADRSSAIDEINGQILENFKQEKIDIPYHQVDVTLKNSQGQEVRLT